MSSSEASSTKGGAMSEKTKKIVVFDTNAYRVLTYGLDLAQARAGALELRRKEESAGYSALAHPIVVWELLTHLVDPADPAYNYCVNALVALGEHTASRETADGAVCLIADAFATVCLELFGRLPADYEKGLENLGSLVTHIVKHAPDLSDHVAKQNIQHLGQGMEAKEQAWLQGMGSVLNHFAPGTAKVVFGGGNDREALRKARAYLASEAFFEGWSEYIVASNAAELGIAPLPPEQMRAKAAVVRKQFPVPFRLMSALLQKLATVKPPDLTNPKRKRWNFIWDSMISFSIGPGTIDEASVYMVTGDGDIIEAAMAAGYGNQVVSLESYLSSIGIK